VNRLLEAARAFVQRGFSPIPVPFRTKSPRLPEWQKLRLIEEQLLEYFTQEPQNIGLLCGEPSHGLANVDCDCEEVIAAARFFLPETQMRSGRKSKPDSHYWYIAAELGKTAQFRDIPPEGETGGAMLIELRSNGAQTLVPPSVHPSGEDYVWHEQGEPQEVERAALLRCVQKTAACALLARHWPGQGSRHSMSLALAGFLLSGGISPEGTAQFLRVAAQVAGDEEIDDRVNSVQDTQRRLEAGEPVTGYTALLDCLPGQVVKKLADWLGLKKQPKTAKAKTRTARSGASKDEGDTAVSPSSWWQSVGRQSDFGLN
jgi:hypothetical protein